MCPRLSQIANSITAGFWTTDLMGENHFRVVNNTQTCKGPRLVVYRDVPTCEICLACATTWPVQAPLLTLSHLFWLLWHRADGSRGGGAHACECAGHSTRGWNYPLILWITMV